MMPAISFDSRIFENEILSCSMRNVTTIDCSMTESDKTKSYLFSITNPNFVIYIDVILFHFDASTIPYWTILTDTVFVM